MIEISSHENFTFGFEIGWIFLDLFLGCYTISFDLNPGDKIEFEEDKNDEE
jgi:hypothetical protein